MGDRLWLFNAFPDADLSPGNTDVIAQDVLLAIHYHIHIAVKDAEHEVLSKPRKTEIFWEFERHVDTDSAQLGKRLRCVDLLNSRFRAQGVGLVRDHSENNVWEIVH